MRIGRGALVLISTLVLVAATVGLWVHTALQAARHESGGARQSRKADFEKWNKPLSEGRCAIAVARFGGGRARLVRVETDGTIHFAVVESAVRNGPMNPLHQGDWLRSKYGAAPTTTLGTYSSTQAALNRAGQLCPPALRCLPGRPGCDRTETLPNPHDLFTRPPGPSLPPTW